MRIGFVVFVLALAACNPQPATFGPDVERNFMMACEGQGSSNALCSCTWDKIAENVTPGDFAALERMPGPQRESHPLTAQINGYVETCNAGLTPQVEPTGEEPVPEP
ncbi:MAG: hypothetical protein IPL62_19965 [Caulobacteraceae bacterium]|nr:hypothetical protein [Caulobacteraceae bacterium]